VHRRAAGETLRELAADYGVAHTTLGRYFTRPEITSQLKQSGRLVRRERRAAAERRALERRMEREVRRQATQQVALEGRLRAARAVRTAGAAARGRRRSAYAAWLDERDARLPLTRADLHSRNDELAAQTVADGAGVQAVLEATGLRTRKNVLRLIDPVILVQASTTMPPRRSPNLHGIGSVGWFPILSWFTGERPGRACGGSPPTTGWRTQPCTGISSGRR